MRKLIILLCLFLATSAVQAMPMMYTFTYQLESPTGVSWARMDATIIGEDLDDDNYIDSRDDGEVLNVIMAWQVTNEFLNQAPSHLYTPSNYLALRPGVYTGLDNRWELDQYYRPMHGSAFLGFLNDEISFISVSGTLSNPRESLHLVQSIIPSSLNEFMRARTESYPSIPFRYPSDRDPDIYITTRLEPIISPAPEIYHPSPVPEPSTAWLLLPGLLGLAFMRQGQVQKYYLHTRKL